MDHLLFGGAIWPNLSGDVGVKRKTIVDIAQMAGVCIGTVSRVINNKDKVHPATRQRILELIEATGYRPNALGQSLKRRRSQNILLEVCNIVDPYSSALSENISKRCHEIGYRMLLADSRLDPTLEAEHLLQVRDGNVDGIIISPIPVRDNIPLFRKLADSKFPIVVLDIAVPTVELNQVKYDDFAAGTMAMEHLFSKGHERIAFVQWWPEFQTVRDRRRAYAASCKKRGLSAGADYVVTLPKVFGDWNKEMFDRLLKMPKPPSAILAENEIVAVACINFFLSRGMRVPGDVAVMGFGDAIMESLVPVPLSTVALNHDEACLKAVTMLKELIENRDARDRKPAIYVQQPSLVIRESA